MLWELRWRRDQFSVEAAVEKGRDIPEWFLDEPELEYAEYFYIRAFWDLTTCRSFGMGLGPIPWKDILQYAIIYELEPDLIQPFIYLVRQLDNQYLDWMDKEEKRKSGKGDT